MSYNIVKHIEDKDIHCKVDISTPTYIYELYLVTREAIWHRKRHKNEDDEVERLPEYVEVWVNNDPTIVEKVKIVVIFSVNLFYLALKIFQLATAYSFLWIQVLSFHKSDKALRSVVKSDQFPVI